MIVEDEAEDMRVSQMGANTDLNFQQPLFKKISDVQRTDSNSSPTPQRNNQKNLASGGVKKVQTQKSITGGIQKM